VTSRTKGEADLWLASAATDTARGEWVDPNAGKIALRGYAEEWLPKSLELYTYLLDRLILPGLGDLSLNGITPMAVRKWRADLLRARRPGPSTVAKAYRTLSNILRTAVADNLIARNPCS
jgi:hypothetical protein